VIARAINQLEERVEARLDLFHQELSLLRTAGMLPEPAPAPDVSEADTELPPAPKRGKAMAVTGKAAQWLGAATLIATLLAQLAAMYKPGLVGPAQGFVKLLEGLAGQ